MSEAYVSFLSFLCSGEGGREEEEKELSGNYSSIGLLYLMPEAFPTLFLFRQVHAVHIKINQHQISRPGCT